MKPGSRIFEVLDSVSMPDIRRLGIMTNFIKDYPRKSRDHIDDLRDYQYEEETESHDNWPPELLRTCGARRSAQKGTGIVFPPAYLYVPL